jgi:hypothetical protein
MPYRLRTGDQHRRLAGHGGFDGRVAQAPADRHVDLPDSAGGEESAVGATQKGQRGFDALTRGKVGNGLPVDADHERPKTAEAPEGVLDEAPYRSSGGVEPHDECIQRQGGWNWGA